jgi:subtilase family serine protease
MKALRLNLLLGLCMLLFGTLYAQETQGPVISALIPANESIEVDTKASLKITFDVEVQKGSGAIAIYQQADGSLIESLDVLHDRVMISGNTATIHPLNDLATASAYYVLIDQGAFADLNGTAFAGISDKTTWAFKTITAPAAPTGLTIDIVSDTEVNLNWTDNAHNEGGFIVLRSTVADFSRDKVEKSLTANTTTLKEQALNPDETYYYKVSAYNSVDTVSSNVVANLSCAPDLAFDLFDEDGQYDPNKKPKLGFTTFSLGEKVQLKAAIINQGGCRPNYAANATYKVFLSKDQTVDKSDINLSPATGTLMGDMKEGEVFSVLESLSIPNDTSLLGNHYLIVKIDADQLVYESIEDNNEYSFAVTVSRQPDIKINNLQINNTESPTDGPLEVSFDLINLSNGPIGAFEVGFYTPEESAMQYSTVYVAGMAKGDSIRFNESILISSGCLTSGNFTLIGEANRNKAINEPETGNTDTVQYSYERLRFPELYIAKLKISPKTLEPGEQVTLNYEAYDINRNTDFVYYYLSFDATIGADDIELGKTTSPSPGCGSSVSVSETLSIPAGTVLGDYFILVTMTRSDGTRDVISDEITITKDPDLIIENIIVTNSPQSMGQLSFTYDIVNQGEGPVGASITYVYLSDDNTFTSGAEELIGDVEVPRLAAGARYSGSATLELTSCTASGNKYVFVKADQAGNGAIRETNEGNNVNQTPVAVTIEAVPDLELFVTTSESSTEDNSIVASVNIVSNAAATSINSNLRFYLSNNASFGSGDSELSGSVIEIFPMDCNTNPAPSHAINDEILFLPDGLADGKYVIIAVADADGAIAELNEDNNRDFFVFTKTTPTTTEPNPEPSCTPPSGITVSNITNSTADLSWEAFSGATGYEVYVVGKGVYSTTSTNFTATGLPSGTSTEWAVRTNCGGTFTSWVWGQDFTTTGEVCNPPSGLTVSNITNSTADLSWDAFSGASGYEVYVVGKDVYSTTSNSFTATGLPSGTSTEWAVRTNCGGAFTSWVWGEITTTGEICNPPIRINGK